ncbi:MAG TPA: tetratricopeptide repeat protein [Bryobacteraceae bacterium]|nr:tetratricopeptide repeat protein [Bryobacteraceae bacterium]
MLSSKSAAVLAAVLLPYTAFAAEQWLKLQSSHFELYTTAGEKKGREAILYFEQVRDFFVRTGRTSDSAVNVPVRIIAFRSDKEFEPYRINEYASAFYLEGYDRDYIVMRSISQEHYPVAVHEFTHLLVKHSGAELPIWLNEGLAELYSTLKPMDKKVMVGEVIPGRFYYLQQHKWMSLETLTSVDHNSPYYNERDRAGIFYSESWALAHMLNLANEYRPQFGKFLGLVASGVPSNSAFWQAYAKTINQVQQDLENYLRGGHFNAAVFDVKLEKSAEEPDILPAPAVESGVVLADLLALTGKHEAAKEAYERLAKVYPKSWEVEAGLAELAWSAQDLEDARRHFARAAELGSTNPRLYFDYAMMLRALGESNSAAIPPLKKAVELNPDYQDAHLHLAYCLLQDRQYQEALDHFGKVKHLKVERASTYYHGIAYADYHLEKFDEARKAAEAAKKYAQNLVEAGAADDMLRVLDQAKERRALTAEQLPPPSHPTPQQASERPKRMIRRADTPQRPSVLGTLRQVDCLDRIFRLRIATNEKQVLLAIRDPGNVTVKGSPPGTIDFVCGPQKARLVVVEYENREDAALGTIGDVRSIEFQ